MEPARFQLHNISGLLAKATASEAMAAWVSASSPLSFLHHPDGGAGFFFRSFFFFVCLFVVQRYFSSAAAEICSGIFSSESEQADSFSRYSMS